MMEQYIHDPDFGKLKVEEETESYTKYSNMIVLGRYVNLKLRIITISQLDGINEKIRNAFHEFNNTIERIKDKLPDLLMDYYLQNYDTIDEWFTIPAEIDRENITKEKLQRLVKVTDLIFNGNGTYGFLCTAVWDPGHDLAIILSEEKPVITTQIEKIYA